MLGMKTLNREPQNLRVISATHYGSESANNSAIIHPSKRISISRMTSHTRHNDEPILGRNDSFYVKPKLKIIISDYQMGLHKYG